MPPAAVSVDVEDAPVSRCETSPKRSMESPPSSRDAKKPRTTSHQKRVTFVDANWVWFHKDLAPITRFGGLHRPINSTHGDEERRSRELDDEASLTHAYASELRDMIQCVLWGVHLSCTCNDIETLRAQFRVASELHTEAMMEFGQFDPRTCSGPSDEREHDECMPPLLAWKDMTGFRGLGYTFGHRFVTIAEYIATMEDIELVRLLKAHQVAIPPFVLPKASGQRFPASVLVSRHFLCGGRTLDQLSMVELRLECSLRNMVEVTTAKKYKKKKHLVQLLKPFFEQDHVIRCAELQQRDQMDALVSNLLQDAAEAKMLRSLATVLRRRMPSLQPTQRDEDAPPTKELLSAWFAKLLQDDPTTRCQCTATTLANATA